jgi:hypothetical protein
MENLLEPDLIPTQHSSLFLQVWQQAVQSVRIGRWDDGRSSQMTLTLARLMCQLMAHKSMLHLVFAGCRLAETLGGTSFSLHLWHSGLEKKASTQVMQASPKPAAILDWLQ